MRKLLIILAFSIVTTTFAQEISGPQYNTAIGGKISSGIAFSYKKFVANTHALEAQAMYFKKGVRFIGLYQFHFYNIEGLNGLAWYAGPGAHLGVWFPKFKDEFSSPIDLGIDGVIGLDYKIPNTPVNISLDWQPSFGILGDAGLQPQFGGLGIRYVLN
jgi:hypothetical protein